MKKNLFVLFFLFIIGCGGNIENNNETNTTIKAPYSLDKFKPVLNISKLQAPTSEYDPKYSTHYGEFEGVYNEYFYLEDNRYMTFYMCEEENDHRRSELRFKDDFKVSSFHYIRAKLKIFPLNEEKEFTFLQIHADAHYPDTPNKPLLRVAWRKDYNDLKDHLWAIIRLSASEANYLKVDLGKRPEDFFNILVEVNDSYLNITLNGKKEVDNFDVSYWDDYYNYFKAGVYLQGKGCAKTLFDELEVK
jgi:hypothetical protein